MDFYVRITGLDGSADEFTQAIQEKLKTIELDGAEVFPTVEVTVMPPEKIPKKSPGVVRKPSMTWGDPDSSAMDQLCAQQLLVSPEEERRMVAEIRRADAASYFISAGTTAATLNAASGWPSPSREYVANAGSRVELDPPNRGARWTDEEVDRLRRMWGENTPVAAIARNLGRTVAGVEAKLVQLGLIAATSYQQRYRR